MLLDLKIMAKRLKLLICISLRTAFDLQTLNALARQIRNDKLKF